MTPQEKADELHVGYWRLTNDSRIAKQCALMAVNEIINSEKFIWGEYNRDEYRRYFQEVKIEIEKIYYDTTN
jgi:hypothetical protein